MGEGKGKGEGERREEKKREERREKREERDRKTDRIALCNQWGPRRPTICCLLGGAAEETYENMALGVLVTATQMVL